MLQRICSLLRVQPPVLLTRGLLWASGATVPTDGTDGYQTGCLFQKTDGGSGTALYINEGSVTSCDFNAVDAGGITTSIDVGVFSSLTAGDGIPLSASDRSAVAIYGDDAGLSIASNVYNLRTRLLLTVDQDGASIRALMAQLKLATGVDVSTGVYTASQGYVELAGTHSCETGAQFSCFDASLEIGTALTVDAGGKMAGIYIETTGSGTITNNGICSAIIITKATGAASWPSGITIDGSTVQHAILVGSTDDGEGVVLSATVTKAVGIYAELETDAGSGYNVRPLRSRLRVDVGANVETETYGIQGQLNAYASTNLGHWHGGVLGTVEGSTATVRIYNPLAGVGAVIGRIGGTITIDTAGWAASFVALANATMTLTSGQYMGLYVTKTSGKTSFSRGIYIDGSAVDYGIMVGEHSNTVGDGVTVSDTTKRIVGFFADDNAVGTAGGAFISVARGRLLITGSTCSGEQYGLHGTVIYRPAASVSINGWTAGVLGTLEGATGMTVSSVAGAIAARVGFGVMRPTVAGRVAGVFSLNNMGAELTSGTTSAFLTYTVGTVKWTNGLEIYADSCVTGIAVGSCTTGITFAGTFTNDAILVGTSGTPLVYPLSTTQNTCVSIYADLTDPGTSKFFRGLYVRTRYMPSDTEGGASVYGIRGHVLTVATYDNVGTDENICGVHGYVTGTADALLNQAGITVAGIRGELGGTGTDWDVKIACAIEAKVCLTALPSSTVNAYCGVSVYAPTSDATPLDCAIYCWGYIQGGIDLRGCAGDSLDWVFAVSANDAAVSASEGAVGTHGTVSRKIAILVDGDTYYLLVSTVPTFA